MDQLQLELTRGRKAPQRGRAASAMRAATPQQPTAPPTPSTSSLSLVPPDVKPPTQTEFPHFDTRFKPGLPDIEWQPPSKLMLAPPGDAAVPEAPTFQMKTFEPPPRSLMVRPGTSLVPTQTPTPIGPKPTIALGADPRTAMVKSNTIPLGQEPPAGPGTAMVRVDSSMKPPGTDMVPVKETVSASPRGSAPRPDVIYGTVETGTSLATTPKPSLGAKVGQMLRATPAALAGAAPGVVATSLADQTAQAETGQPLSDMVTAAFNPAQRRADLYQQRPDLARILYTPAQLANTQEDMNSRDFAAQQARAQARAQAPAQVQELPRRDSRDWMFTPESRARREALGFVKPLPSKSTRQIYEEYGGGARGVGGVIHDQVRDNFVAPVVDTVSSTGSGVYEFGAGLFGAKPDKAPASASTPPATAPAAASTAKPPVFSGTSPAEAALKTAPVPEGVAQGMALPYAPDFKAQPPAPSTPVATPTPVAPPSFDERVRGQGYTGFYDAPGMPDTTFGLYKKEGPAGKMLYATPQGTAEGVQRGHASNGGFVGAATDAAAAQALQDRMAQSQAADVAIQQMNRGAEAERDLRAAKLGVSRGTLDAMEGRGNVGAGESSSSAPSYDPFSRPSDSWGDTRMRQAQYDALTHEAGQTSTGLGARRQAGPLAAAKLSAAQAMLAPQMEADKLRADHYNHGLAATATRASARAQADREATQQAGENYRARLREMADTERADRKTAADYGLARMREESALRQTSIREDGEMRRTGLRETAENTRLQYTQAGLDKRDQAAADRKVYDEGAKVMDRYTTPNKDGYAEVPVERLQAALDQLDVNGLRAKTGMSLQQARDIKAGLMSPEQAHWIMGKVKSWTAAQPSRFNPFATPPSFMEALAPGWDAEQQAALKNASAKP